jgi:hypothetical protein
VRPWFEKKYEPNRESSFVEPPPPVELTRAERIGRDAREEQEKSLLVRIKRFFQNIFGWRRM